MESRKNSLVFAEGKIRTHDPNAHHGMVCRLCHLLPRYINKVTWDSILQVRHVWKGLRKNSLVFAEGKIRTHDPNVHGMSTTSYVVDTGGY